MSWSLKKELLLQMTQDSKSLQENQFLKKWQHLTKTSKLVSWGRKKKSWEFYSFP